MLARHVFALTAGLAAMGSAHAQFVSGRQSTNLTLPLMSQPATTVQRIGITTLTVTYSRPLVAGRKVWGGIVPYGQVWRAGANENTTFQTTDAITVEGQPLAAGTYGLHIIPAEDAWTVIFSKNHTSWGSFTYNQEEDALRVTVKPRPAEVQDALSYTFDNLAPDSAELTMKWEKIALPVRVKVDVYPLTLTSIRSQMRGLAGYVFLTYADGAEWLLDRKMELPQALKWVDQSIQMRPVFMNLQLKSRVLEAMGKESEAAAALKTAIDQATIVEAYTYARQMQIGGKQREAIEVFRKVPAKDPGSWVAHLAVARVRSSEKAFPEAAKEARIALESAPEVQRPNIERLVAQLESGKDIN